MSLRFANPRRFVASSQHKSPTLPQAVLDRVTVFIDDGVPFKVPKYFRKSVSQEHLSRTMRRQTSEAVLDLLLRRLCFDEAFEIVHFMSDEGMRLSAPVRAKVLTIQFVNKMITQRTFLHNLGKLFQRRKFATEKVADRHFHDLLHHLVRAENSIEVLEEVVRLYIEKRGERYRLDSFSIAFMITCHFAAGREADAERWLDYHSKRPTPDNSVADPAFCFPYASFVHARLAAAPKEDPRLIYGPVLDRMARDYAWPDTVLINILITAELRHNHPDRALALYDTLRSHTARGVYPDETTYSQLFVAASRRASEQRKSNVADFPIPPRVLFREMAEMHAFVHTGRIAGRTPVLTKVSLGAALRHFVTSGDYAGAIIALTMYKQAQVPLERLVIRKVVAAIVERCRNELNSTRENTWVDIFLDLRGIPRRRVRNLSEWEMTRRVISVVRRALALSQWELYRMLDEIRAESQLSELSQASAEEGSEQPSESVSETSSADSEVKTETSQGTQSTSIRAEKKERMRNRRFGFIDVLLSRALETNILVEGKDKPREPARKAVEEAGAVMIPDTSKILRGILDESRLKNATPTHESESK